MRWSILIVLGACYQAPSYEHCALQCMPNAANACPSGMECRPAANGNYCHERGRESCSATDAGTDASNDGNECFGRGELAGPFITFCPATDALSPIRASLTYTGGVFDTGTMTGAELSCDTVRAQQGANAPELCFKVADKITVAGSLRAEGPRVLVLVGIEAVEVFGTLDVSGDVDFQPPAAEGYATSGSGSGDGGGAGGNFSTDGALGGAGPATGPIGRGMPIAAVNPTFVRGGVRGGHGGGASIGGGRSGGAVYLLSREAIVVRGTITASGQGGGGGFGTSAGAGGGSGGMIVLDANAINVYSSALIIALGGGGGGGSNATSDGMRGSDAVSFSRAPGGDGAASSGRGGFGSALGLAPLPGDPGVSPPAGTTGGGGGGGSGWIRFSPMNTVFPVNTTAPAPVY